MKGAEITKHAYRQCGNRMGLPKRALARKADAALKDGITADEAKGELRLWMKSLKESHGGEADNIRVYDGFVYIFTGKTLITAYSVRKEYRKQARDAQKKKEEKTDGRETDGSVLGKQESVSVSSGCIHEPD